MSVYTGQGIILEKKEFEEKFGVLETREEFFKCAFDLYQKCLSNMKEKEIFIAKIHTWQECEPVFFIGELFEVNGNECICQTWSEKVVSPVLKMLGYNDVKSITFYQKEESIVAWCNNDVYEDSLL